MKNNDFNPQHLWDMWDRCKEYQSKIGLRKNISTYIDFFEGRQWPKATPRTKSLPRPVINIVKMICRNKESAILSNVVKLIYKAENEEIDAEKFTNFADYIMKEMRQEEYDTQAIHDGSLKGTYFYHYYWDAEAKGKVGNMQGGARVETINILNVGFANPRETDEQKQKWIIIVSREDVDSIKAKADKDVDKDQIKSDTNEEEENPKEQDDNSLVTVITRYFRQNGEVYCERATKATYINKPFPISPDPIAAKKTLGIEDAPNNSLPDSEESKPLKSGKATLYPVVVGNYEARESSIYGIGEVEGLIPNQKAINFNMAMMLLAAQNNAWSKYIVNEDALRGQEITNEPGQVLTDYSKTGVGIRKLEGSSLNQTPIQIINTLTDLTRVVTGSTEVMTGEAISANMSGAAIAQLQSQAQQPIEKLRDNFWRVKEKQGRVLEQFFKLFYYKKDFSYNKTEQVVADGVLKEKEISVSDSFSGTDFADVEFSVVVEATAGTKSSAAGDINMLDNLLAKGLIDKKTYIKAYPKNALNNKTEILKAVEEEEQGQVKQLTQQLQQVTQELQAMQEQVKQDAEIIQQQKGVVDKVVSVIKENNQLRSIVATIYAESKEKIEQGNQAIQELNRRRTEAESDATEFAQALYARGV